MNSQRGRPARIADELDVLNRQALALTGIDDQPVFAVGRALKVLTDQVAHLRAGTVGTHQVVAAHLALLAPGILHNGRHSRSILPEVNQLQTTAELHCRPLGHLAAQRLLQLRLIEGHQPWMTIDAAGGVGAGELAQPRAVHAHFGNGDARKS